jgi:16S rRNA C1402 N4-methylase RsmH
MPKPNPLAQGLNQSRAAAVTASTSAVEQPVSRVVSSSSGSRSGRVLVGGHFASEVQRALRIIAAEESTTVQALLAEGINTVFAKRGKPEIAGLPTIRSL